MSQLFINPPTLASMIDQYRDRLDRLGLDYRINESGQAISAEELSDQARTAEAIVAGLEKLDADFFGHASKLKMVAKYGVGFDNIDLNAAKTRGIDVSRTLGSNSQAVADCALSTILALLHRLPQRHANILQGGWQRSRHTALTGLTIAIIGFGRIGSRLARHAKHFSWHVLAVDPAMTSADELEFADELCSLDEAISRADIVSLHYPKENQRADFGAREFASMKPGAIFVNMARGGLVDEGQLVNALRSGQLGGAALDVFAREPIPDPNVWRQLPNVVLTPHIAGSSDEAVRAGFEMCLEAIEFKFGLSNLQPRASFF